MQRPCRLAGGHRLHLRNRLWFACARVRLAEKQGATGLYRRFGAKALQRW